MRQLALLLIRAYQRWISPHKGFACAHRVHRGGASCSSAGFRLIRRHGLRQGLPLLRERLRRCGEIARVASLRPRALQRGDCDCGVVPDCDIDLSGRRCSANACELAGNACGCDWPSRKTKAEASRKTRR